MEQVGKKGVLETDVLTVALHGTFPFIHPWFYFPNEQVLPIPHFVRLFKDSCREDRRWTEAWSDLRHDHVYSQQGGTFATHMG